MRQSMKHETGYRADQVLSDWHGDQNQNAESTIFQFAHLGYSVLVPIHELGEILRIVSLGALEGKVHLSWRGKNVTRFVAFTQQVCVGYSGRFR